MTRALNENYAPYPDVVSEGQGYGMNEAVEEGDQAFFDELETYNQTVLERRHQPGNLPAPYLMCWHWSNLENRPLDTNFATDGDFDRLGALWKAAAKWGSNGAINYRARALLIANDLITYGFKLINGKRYLMDNYYSPLNNPGDVNPSYYDITTMRRCRQETSDQRWDQAIEGSYALLPQTNGTTGALATTTGLFPNWCQLDNNGVVQLPASYRDSKYTYDAIRTAWRIFRDWYFEGEQRARNLLIGKLLTFLTAQWNNGAGSIKAEYNHDGSVAGNYESTLMYMMNAFVFFAQSPTNTLGTNIYNNKVISTYAQHPGGSYWGVASYYGNGLLMQAVRLKEKMEKNAGYWTRTNSQAFMN